MNHKEMKRLAEDPAAVRSLATMLLKMRGCEWTDWEIDFLENMQRHAGSEPISIKQREVLSELRDRTKTYTIIDGLSVKKLIDDCWIAHLDLSEEDEAFIGSLKDQSEKPIRERPLLRLLHCARQLNIVERYVAIDR